LNRFVDFHEIWYGGNAIQGDLDAIIFNPMASKHENIIVGVYWNDVSVPG
jgi:hypothetical protein